MHPEIILRRKLYHESEMSADNDISSGASPNFRYCIANIPRSGSTLLARMLARTGVAGAPREYLNPLFLNAWARMNPGERLALGTYITGIESRRTSENGVFGIKIHWRHVKNLLARKVPEAMVRRLLMRHDRFIFITRRDKLRQAISYYIAESTGIFHADQQGWAEDFGIALPSLSPERVLRHLADILDEERGWTDFFRKSGKPFIRVEYEDLISDYAGTCSGVLNFLGVEAGEIPKMTPRMAHRGLQEKFRDEMLGIMGIDAGQSNAPE
jgi:LPS sulfotransferase NodH